MALTHRLKGHESFIPREGWITKALFAIQRDPMLFTVASGADALGVGTNMAKSIRYWMRTAGLTDETQNHGVYLTEPKLDLPRVARIREAANVPLVMHGGSGVSDEDYAVAIENGICKVNYYTYMNVAGGKASKEFWKDDETNFYDSMAIKATEAIKEDVKRAIKVFQKL